MGPPPRGRAFAPPPPRRFSTTQARATWGSRHGFEGLKLATESHRDAVNRIARNVSELNIDCDFQRLDAYLFISPNGYKEDFLETEIDAAQRLGLEAQWVPRAPIDGFDTGKCLRYLNQARFHPSKLLAALEQAILRNGGAIYNNTHASAFK